MPNAGIGEDANRRHESLGERHDCRRTSSSFIEPGLRGRVMGAVSPQNGYQNIDVDKVSQGGSSGFKDVAQGCVVVEIHAGARATDLR